jgi:L-ornithine N5-oxygenase
MECQEVEILGIGAGPANLAMAVAVEELAGPELAGETLIIEQHDDIVWQRGMLLPWTQSQVSFLKDLVTLRNPRSEFSFVNYLHAIGRLDEFINLGSFTPYRVEISGYLQWVAKSLRHTRIEYGRRCVSVEPVAADDGEVRRWSVHTADGGEILCRNLVIGAGRDAHIPAELGALPRKRIIHSTEYAPRCAELDPEGAHRIVVVGGAQSAAELFWASYQRFPNAQVTMVMRSIGLNTYESSKFTNELYYPSFIDEFYAALPEAREQLLREMHRSNYAGLAPGMLETLYREMYQERLMGTERLQMITMAEITGARLEGDDVVLSLTDRKTRRTDELHCDAVLLGTGFVRSMPKLIQELTEAADVGGATVDRNYRMNLPPSYTARCYLQGVNEATHGIADSLLSVLAIRAQEIVSDMLAHLDRKPATELLLNAP